MLKYKLMFDKDKETQWLNEMSNQGWAMTGFFAGLYTFEACEPGKYVYQVDFGDHFFSASEDYREFQLYTDVDSSIEHYKKIRRMFKVVTIFELLLTIFEFAWYGYTNSASSLICAIILMLIGVYLTMRKVKQPTNFED